MSKLDELMQELCPDGVEYVSLGEVANYAKRRIDVSETDKKNYVGVENLLRANLAGHRLYLKAF